MPKSRHRRKGKARPRESAPPQRATDRVGAQLPAAPSIPFLDNRSTEIWVQELSRVYQETPMWLPGGYHVGQLLDPIAATDYLHLLRHNLEAEAARLAQVYSPVAWLWYLRRTPHRFFRGEKITVEASDHALAEALTSQSQTDELCRTIPSYGLTYEISERALRSVARMGSLARRLGQTHSYLRRAGKGCRFTVSGDTLPKLLADQDLEAAIALFDQRVADDPGTSFSFTDIADFTATSPNNNLPLINVSRVRGDWPNLIGWAGPLRQHRMVKMRANFIPRFVTLRHIEELVNRRGMAGTGWWDPALPSLILLLKVLAYDAIEVSDSMGINLPRVGYTVRTIQVIEDEMRKALPMMRDSIDDSFPGGLPQTGSEVVEALLGIVAELWPHRVGPVIRRAGDVAIIDVSAATRRLGQMIIIPPDHGDELANDRSRMFEEVVQEMIDSTPWAPPPPIRLLHRRKIRRQGRAITDIDAIGANGSALLLISCKNVAFSMGHDAGIYSVVRNARTMIEDAVSRLKSIIEVTKKTPLGDNFDFSEFENIFGVVVTPHVMFVNLGEATATAVPGSPGPSLRWAVSLSELKIFLEDPIWNQD